MKVIKYALSFLFIVTTSFVFSQTNAITGKVSYISSKNIYVKFESTRDINVGDSLYMLKNSDKIPVLQVAQKSSISCVCTALSEDSFTIGQEVIFKTLTVEKEVPEIITDKNINKTQEAEIDNLAKATEKKTDKKKLKKKKVAAKIKGRLSASAYTNFTSDEPIDDPKMRYTLSLSGDAVSAADLNFSSYISFRHKINHWADIQDNVFSGLKIYDLAVNKSFSNFEFTIGRKINRTVSNIGAIDGLQMSYSAGDLSFGAIIGTRPDHSDYSINFNLPEAGLYVAHTYKSNTGSLNNTLGIFEQRVGSATDRRYLYFQHSNTLVKKLYLFGSFQLDLYELIDEVPQNDLRLTSLYLSARYRISKKIDLFASYDTRKNVVYYETYKNSLDQLIDQATRQGLRLRLILRPLKYVTTGISGTYRMENGGLGATKNLHGYINYARVPVLKMSTALSYTFLDTYYLNSHIFGIRMNKDFYRGKIGTSLNYRYVNYIYDVSQNQLRQHIAGINLNWRIFNQLSLSLSHEISFTGDKIYHRSYFKLIKRIKH